MFFVVHMPLRSPKRGLGQPQARGRTADGGTGSGTAALKPRHRDAAAGGWLERNPILVSMAVHSPNPIYFICVDDNICLLMTIYFVDAHMFIFCTHYFLTLRLYVFDDDPFVLMTGSGWTQSGRNTRKLTLRRRHAFVIAI